MATELPVAFPSTPVTPSCHWTRRPGAVTNSQVTWAAPSVGATTHCLHGAEASVEELLDWRPYDYFTLRNTIQTPLGALRMLETTEFEPTPDGTVIRWRWGAPKTARERAIMAQMEPFLDEVMAASAALLTGQLADELKRRRLEAGEEPDLPTPRRDGPLAGITPAP